MKSTNPQVQKIVDDINKLRGEDNMRELHEAVKELGDMLDKQACGGCDACEEEGPESTQLADMLEEALLEGDSDALINALASALMVSAKANGWTDLSAMAHAVWVES